MLPLTLPLVDPDALIDSEYCETLALTDADGLTEIDKLSLANPLAEVLRDWLQLAVTRGETVILADPLPETLPDGEPDVLAEVAWLVLILPDADMLPLTVWLAEMLGVTDPLTGETLGLVEMLVEPEALVDGVCGDADADIVVLVDAEGVAFAERDSDGL